MESRTGFLVGVGGVLLVVLLTLLYVLASQGGEVASLPAPAPPVAAPVGEVAEMPGPAASPPPVFAPPRVETAPARSAPEPGIQGIVLDPQGGIPLWAEVTLYLRDPGERNLARCRRWRVRCRTDGRFARHPLPSGHYVILAQHPDWSVATKGVNLSEERPGVEVRISLAPPTSISGRVVQSDTLPLGQVRVEAWESQGAAGSVDVSDEWGFFVLSGVERGKSYELKVSRPGYFSPYRRPPRASGGATDVELTLLPAATVSGRLLDSDDLGIPGALVIARRVKKKVDRVAGLAFTGAGGGFQIGDLPPEPIELQALHPQGGQTSPLELALAEGSVTEDLILRLTTEGSISGRVVDLEGRPLARVPVLARGGGRREPVCCETWTDADGIFTLKGVGEGPVRLTAGVGTVQGSDYSARGTPARAGEYHELVVKVASGTVFAHLIFPEGAPAPVRDLRLKTASGELLPASLPAPSWKLGRDDPGLTAMQWGTDVGLTPLGGLEIRRVPAGTEAVLVDLQDAMPLWLPLDPDRDPDRLVHLGDVVVQREACLEGYVTCATGPVEGALVRVLELEETVPRVSRDKRSGPTGPRLSSQLAQEDGKYRLEGLRPGRYLVKASRSGLCEAEKVVEIEPVNTTVNLDLYLLHSGSIAGEVQGQGPSQDDPGTRRAGLTVQAALQVGPLQEPPLPFETLSDGKGRFLLPLLPAGRFRLVAMDESGADPALLATRWVEVRNGEVARTTLVLGQHDAPEKDPAGAEESAGD